MRTASECCATSAPVGPLTLSSETLSNIGDTWISLRSRHVWLQTPFPHFTDFFPVAPDTVSRRLFTTLRFWANHRLTYVAGVVGPAEDQSEYDLHDQFNTNFLGTLYILQSSLAYFRDNSIPGRYLIFSSTSGALGVPGLAPYCATKYAVEGLIESMLYETDCFGIKATLVEPGYMRLDDAEDGLPGSESSGTNMHAGARNMSRNLPLPRTPKTPSMQPPSNPAPLKGSPANPSAPAPPKRYGHFSIKPASAQSPYNSPHSPAGHAKRVFQWLNMRQPVSAVRSAELVWQLGHCSYPPLRLLLGNYAVESIRDRLRSVIEEIEDWKFLSFPNPNGEGSEAGGDAGGAGEGDGYGDGEGEGEGEGLEGRDEADAGREQDDEQDARGERDVMDVEVNSPGPAAVQS